MKTLRHSLLLLAWVGVILPSCPCKVLSLFGINLHGSDRNTGREAMQVCTEQGFPCHCDQEISPNAEQTDLDDPCGAPKAVDAGSALMPGQPRRGLADPWSVHTDHPPPGFAFPLASEGRSLLAVYRL